MVTVGDIVRVFLYVFAAGLGAALVLVCLSTTHFAGSQTAHGTVSRGLRVAV